MTGLSYIKVYLVSGHEFAFPIDSWDELESAMSQSTFNDNGSFIKLRDFDGSMKMIRVEEIMYISESTPETRETWGRNHQKIQREQIQFNAKYSDPLNQL